MLIVVCGALASFSPLSSLALSAVGRTTSAISRCDMSAPSMKKRSSRNMMSIIGIKLGETSSLTGGILCFDMGQALLGAFLVAAGRALRFGEHHALEQVDGLQVHRQGHLRDLVLVE